jgi:hypothetical protein
MYKIRTKPTGVHGRGEHEPGRVRQRRERPANGDLAVFERLAQVFQHGMCCVDWAASGRKNYESF